MSTITKNDVFEKVEAILIEELGELTDGENVTEVITGFAEPGYASVFSDEDDIVVLGNWNPKRFPRYEENKTPLTDEENLGPRLYERLEEAGAECHWLDEWTMCQECYKAVRTQPDCYSWKPYYLMTEHCEIICGDCVKDNLDFYIPEVSNNSDKCLTFVDKEELEAIGFMQWEPDNPQTYQNGWHRGMDDKPEDVLAVIDRTFPEYEAVFLLDESSQFYISFSAWVRLPE